MEIRLYFITDAATNKRQALDTERMLFNLFTVANLPVSTELIKPTFVYFDSRTDAAPLGNKLYYFL